MRQHILVSFESMDGGWQAVVKQLEKGIQDKAVRITKAEIVACVAAHLIEVMHDDTTRKDAWCIKQ